MQNLSISHNSEVPPGTAHDLPQQEQFRSEKRLLHMSVLQVLQHKYRQDEAARGTAHPGVGCFD